MVSIVSSLKRYLRHVSDKSAQQRRYTRYPYGLYTNDLRYRLTGRQRLRLSPISDGSTLFYPMSRLVYHSRRGSRPRSRVPIFYRPLANVRGPRNGSQRLRVRVYGRVGGSKGGRRGRGDRGSSHYGSRGSQVSNYLSSNYLRLNFLLGLCYRSYRDRLGTSKILAYLCRVSGR